MRREEDRAYRRILALLHASKGVDFSHYKPGTIRRRILRRMALNRMVRLADFARRLERNPAEVVKLYDEILIHVTSFFRDPEVYEALKRDVYPHLLKGRPASAPIRVWVAGCSSGEEAYSHAMNLLEHLAQTGQRRPVHLFATDLSDESLSRARAGFYPAKIAAELSASRLRRFFLKVPNGYRVRPEVRGLFVFARHDMVKDPPFRDLDLVSCRNVLIYLGPGLHRRALHLFHYALRIGGVLMLGGSESLPEPLEGYRILNRRARLYSRLPTALGPRFDFAGGTLTTGDGAAARKGDIEMKTETTAFKDSDVKTEVDRYILSRYAPAGVLVNEGLEILQFHGQTSPYLTPAPGKASLNLMKMAQAPLLPALASAVAKARRGGCAVRVEKILMTADGREREVGLEVTPIRPDSAHARSFLIIFEEAAPSTATPGELSSARAGSAEIRRLRSDLATTREYLQSLVREQESSSAELSVANADNVAANEELRSTNEELETAKEELQSSNEELQAGNEELSTLNEELNARNAELDKANSDLFNLLASASLPIVMLGADLRVRLMTPAAQKAFGLMPSDVGRSLLGIRLKLRAPRLAQTIREVLRSRRPQEREVRDARGNWYTMWVRPYSVPKKRIAGVVIALADITERKRSEEARVRLATIAQDSSDAIVFYDKKARITAWNRGAERMFGWNEAEALKLGLSDLCSESGRKRELALLRKSLRGRRVLSFESVGMAKDGRLLTLSVIWTPIRDFTGRFDGIASTLRDITEQKRAESRRIETLVSGVPFASLLVDAAGAVVLSNPKAEEIFGYKTGGMVGREVGHLLPPSLRGGHSRKMRDYLRAPKAIHKGEARKLQAARRDGSLFPVEVTLIPVKYEGRPAVLTYVVDITERRQAQEAAALRQKEAMHRDLIANASHEMRTPVAAIKGFSEALHDGALSDPTAAPRFLRVIEENADQLAKMVDDLLELSALESGLDKRHRHGRIFLRRLVLKEVEGFSEMARRKGVALKARVGPGLRVIGNPAQLRHVLQNLIENAIQYNRPGGFVEVSARRSRSALRVCVRDNGIGIPKGQLETVFERFQRTKRAAARVVRGTGLGLSIAKAVVEGHGGRIWAERARGGGTALVFTLPAAGKPRWS